MMLLLLPTPLPPLCVFTAAGLPITSSICAFTTIHIYARHRQHHNRLLLIPPLPTTTTTTTTTNTTNTAATNTTPHRRRRHSFPLQAQVTV
jgi:hypothetical protein